MKIKRSFLLGLLLGAAVLFTPNSDAQAQCAMCAMNAENSVQEGNTQGKGLNDGILFLLGMPYLAVAVVGFIWYKKFRGREHANTAV